MLNGQKQQNTHNTRIYPSLGTRFASYLSIIIIVRFSRNPHTHNHLSTHKQGEALTKQLISRVLCTEERRVICVLLKKRTRVCCNSHPIHPVCLLGSSFVVVMKCVECRCLVWHSVIPPTHILRMLASAVMATNKNSKKAISSYIIFSFVVMEGLQIKL